MDDAGRKLLNHLLAVQRRFFTLCCDLCVEMDLNGEELLCRKFNLISALVFDLGKIFWLEIYF